MYNQSYPIVYKITCKNVVFSFEKGQYCGIVYIKDEKEVTFVDYLG